MGSRSVTAPAGKVYTPTRSSRSLLSHRQRGGRKIPGRQMHHSDFSQVTTNVSIINGGLIDSAGNGVCIYI